MFAGHNPYLVTLSVAVAMLGGYTGFGLASRVRAAASGQRRLLLASAAGFLAVGIWTMHFVGMLAAPIPAGAVYLILPTIVSFLICALVVGVSLFFVSVGPQSDGRVIASAVLLGTGIVTMHYVGIHGLAGPFHIEHDYFIVALSVLIALASAYGGLRIYLARHGGWRLAVSAAIFGIAVSGMHYTAMYGMTFIPSPAVADHAATGLAASPQELALIVAVLCFFVAASFLLFLIPEPRKREKAPAGYMDATGLPNDFAEEPPLAGHDGASATGRRRATAPLRGLGQASAAPVQRIPIESADGIHFVDVADIRSVKADAHYTLVHDGARERMCNWSISEVEAQLDSGLFLRVHRSHIVAIPHVTLLRREGDGAVVELDGDAPHLVPVSRARLAELRALLGLGKRNGNLQQAHSGQRG